MEELHLPHGNDHGDSSLTTFHPSGAMGRLRRGLPTKYTQRRMEQQIEDGTTVPVVLALAAVVFFLAYK